MQSIPYSCVSSIDSQPSKTSPKGLDFQEIPLNGSCGLVEFGKGAALDLIKGHLTEQANIPATRGLQNDPIGWFVPSVDYDPQKETHFVAKLQAFESGGYEVTISEQNLHELAYLMDMERNIGGVREKGEQKENDIASSIQRSKSKVRKLIKSMGCDRLLTLTRRESSLNDFWTKDDWKEAWDKFNRLCKKAGVTLQYVAVLEAHKKGNYHLHAAIVGRLNVNLARGMWLACTGGKGSGNVDIQMRQNCTVHQRRAGLAKYVSKYITKQADLVEFNKKRYWSSRHKLPHPKRFVLNAVDLIGALKELVDMLSLDFYAVVKVAFVFPASDGMDCTGLWFSFDDDLSRSVPF